MKNFEREGDRKKRNENVNLDPDTLYNSEIKNLINNYL